MLLVYLLLVVAGLVLTVTLARRGSRQAITAGVATVLGMLAVVSGFSIGPKVAAVAAVLLLVAATRRGATDVR